MQLPPREQKYWDMQTAQICRRSGTPLKDRVVIVHLDDRERPYLDALGFRSYLTTCLAGGKAIALTYAEAKEVIARVEIDTRKTDKPMRRRIVSVIKTSFGPDFT